MTYGENFKERERGHFRKYYKRKKMVYITHLKADDKTLCNRNIAWNMNLTRGVEEPTCLTCLGTLKRVENERA